MLLILYALHIERECRNNTMKKVNKFLAPTQTFFFPSSRRKHAKWDPNFTKSQPWHQTTADITIWLERFFSPSASYRLTSCKQHVLRPLSASIIKGICLQWRRTGTGMMRCKEGCPCLLQVPLLADERAPEHFKGATRGTLLPAVRGWVEKCDWAAGEAGKREGMEYLGAAGGKWGGIQVQGKHGIRDAETPQALSRFAPAAALPAPHTKEGLLEVKPAQVSTAQR